MFEHIRAHLQTDAQDAQHALAMAQQAVTAATGALSSARAGVTDAQNAVNAATSTLNAAQATLNSATSDQQAKQAAVAAAQQAVDAWANGEPEETTSLGKPNPAWAAWRRRGVPLQNALTTAQAAAATAAAAAQAAQGSRDQVAAALAGAQQRLTAEQGQAAMAQDRLTAAQNTQTAALATVEQATAQLTAIDARSALFEAVPVDPLTLLSLAEEEQAAMQQLRHSRQQLMTTRKQLRDRHDAMLLAHDTAMDTAAVLAADMATWTDPAYPEPGNAAATLRTLAADSQAARGTPPSRRTDDLAATSATVDTALTGLQAALGRATGLRDAAASRLQKAINAVNTVANDAP